LSPAALTNITAYHWPGNIRELRNAVERAALLSDGPVLDAEMFDFLIGSDRSGAALPEAVTGALSASTEGRWAAPIPDERERIAAVLASCAGNQTRAAEILGIARRTLVKKLSRYKLPRPRKPDHLIC